VGSSYLLKSPLVAYCFSRGRCYSNGDAGILSILDLPVGPALSSTGNSPQIERRPRSESSSVHMPHRTANERLLSSILELAEDAFVTTFLDGTIETWNGGAERLYGYTTAEMVGHSMKCLIAPYEWPTLESIFSHAGDGKLLECEITERIHRDGTRLLLGIRRTPILSDQGDVVGILESAQSLDSDGGTTHASSQLRLLIEQMPVILWTTDQRLCITSHWGGGLNSSRLRPSELVGRSVFELLGCVEADVSPIAEHYEALRGISSIFEYGHKNSVLEIRLKPLRVPSGEITGCIGVGLDITGRKKSEEEILYQARHDALTNLANYREFMDKLEREVNRAERSHRSFTLLLLDLDELKSINDLWGHLAGNRALKRLSAVISAQCRSTDLAARYGGDEFAVVLIDSDEGMARQVAQRVENRLQMDHEEPALSVSIGIGIYPDDGRTAAELIEAADQRLYQRKKELKKRITLPASHTLLKKNAAR
jgi:diguanylate cyclase (GGDEF)-like protein/PAS domain S-box-containing protein